MGGMSLPRLVPVDEPARVMHNLYIVDFEGEIFRIEAL